MAEPKWLKDMNADEYLKEDFDAKGKSKYTVEAYDIAVACQAFFLLKLPLSNKEIEKAINQTVIPGRYQILQENPLIILDGAHNIQAMSNLLAVVHHLAQQKQGKVYALVTMMKDKDLEQVFNLFDAKDEVLLTTLSYPRVAKKDDFPIDVQK